MSESATRHLTILLTDIKGFTDKTSHSSRAGITTMLDDHRTVVLPILQEHGGTLIKTIGDAFLMTFESPTNAVLAGVAVQAALAKRNEGRGADDRLEIRVAINAGEVNLIEGDVYGEAVNITARIEGIAEAGQVYFTEAVYLAMNKTEVPSSEVGLVQLKGIPEKIRVYKVRREEPSMVSVAPAPSPNGSAKAVFVAPSAAASAPAPLPGRRAAALAVDLAICLLLTGGLVGKALVSPNVVDMKVEVPASARKLGIGDKFLDRLSGKPERERHVFVHEKVAEPRPWGRALLLLGTIMLGYRLLFRLYGATPGELAFKLHGPRKTAG